MADILGLMGHVQRQGELGKQQGQQTLLGKLSGQAYTAKQDQRAGILSQMAAVDPRAAQSQQQQFQTGDADRVTQLSQKAKLFVGMAKAGNQQAVMAMYPEIAREAKAAFGVDVPETYDPSFLAGIEQFANINGGGEAEQFTLAPGSSRYDASGRVVAQQPFAPEKPPNAQFQVDQEGNGWWLAPGQSPVPAFGGGAPAPQRPQASQPNRGPGSLDINADLQQFAGLGIPVSSTRRTPDRNREVGGKPNSYHLTGEAVDMTPRTTQERQQARQFWESKGYRVIDEGDHLHAQPPARGMTASQVGGAGPRFGKKDEPKDNAPSGYRYDAAGNLTFIPGGPADPASQSQSKGAPTEGERKSATLLRRMTGSLAQLEQAVKDDPSAASPNLAAEAASKLPFVGRAAANTITPAARQRVEAAQLDILDAALTLGTGAAYTREQLEGYRQSFFPQIGDSQSTIDDKTARLNNVVEAARIAAGRASPDAPAQAAAPAQSGPQPGTVQDGYRFRGGNPADPNAWERL